MEDFQFDSNGLWFDLVFSLIFGMPILSSHKDLYDLARKSTHGGDTDHLKVYSDALQEAGEESGEEIAKFLELTWPELTLYE